MTTPRQRIAERMRQIKQARSIHRSLRVQGGKNIAARYLQRRGWSIEATLHILGYPTRGNT